MGIFVNRRVRAVLADRLGGDYQIKKDGHYKWECIECPNEDFIGGLFRQMDIEAGGWPPKTRFQSIKDQRVLEISKFGFPL